MRPPPDSGPDVAQRHGELLRNRAAKNFRRLQPRFAQEKTTAFRVYDWDIPEVRATADWYDGAAVLSILARTQTDDVPNYDAALTAGLAEALELSPSRVFVKHRRTGPGARYPRLARREILRTVGEAGLKFRVNLSDYIDTGLFLDHRRTRIWLAQQVRGLRLLNLFAYTGAFGVHAAAGGARYVTCVDQSSRNLDWARSNFELNRLSPGDLLTEDVREYLSGCRQRFDWIVVDPPSFSTMWGGSRFSVQEDHPELLRQCSTRLVSGGRLVFSTNHQRFQPAFDGTAWGLDIEEITDQTQTRDHRGTPHRCWLMRRSRREVPPRAAGRGKTAGRGGSRRFGRR